MERFSESEKLISETLDNLPQPFMIFGRKKEHNPVEEFWMNKLECIEKQYDEHIVKLERSLLADRVKKRQLVKKNETISRLRGVLNEKKEKLEALGEEAKKLEQNLTTEKYNAKSMRNKVSKLEYVKSKVMRNLAEERFERMHHEREISKLKRHLENLERDKRFLTQEVATKNQEQTKLADRQVQLVQNKQNLIRSLTELDQERRNQANTNVTLKETVGALMNIGKSHEMQLLKQRKEIDAITEEMKLKRQEHEEVLRQLSTKDKKVKEARDDVKYSKEKMEHLDRQARHWKEQLETKESQAVTSKLDAQDLHRENSGLRCQLAELREKLNRTCGELKSLEMQKYRTEVELQKAQGQARALNMVTCRNELIKQRLAEKILKNHPSVQTALEKRAHENFMRGKGPVRTASERREVEGYKKKIFELERQKKELDRRILESKGRQNRLKSKLEKYSGMGQQILWTEKAMVKLEGDRNRLEDLLKTMALNVPNKLPFQRLVTDPSILDRVAKYEVLQKRLLKQSTRVEELKRTAMKIMEFRRRKSEEELADRRNELPPWKMSHWKRHSSQDTLADVDNQTLDPEGTGAILPERKYYKEYMSYLESEIPSVRKQLALMERRQQQKQQRMLDAETEARRNKYEQEQRDGSFDSFSTVPAATIPTEIILDPLPEDEGDEDEEGLNDDSDMDGLLGVISIDEPSSARVPSTTPGQQGAGDNVDEDNDGADADGSESESHSSSSNLNEEQ